jgi:hypothetical protein
VDETALDWLLPGMGDTGFGLKFETRPIPEVGLADRFSSIGSRTGNSDRKTVLPPFPASDSSVESSCGGVGALDAKL